ncbi:Crp/Fnr family transcriptional regulator [Agrobacterium larrymoorei]|uniref:Crp/Fnr family transcriptional regulator n=1 Tax=Agrobacterium larrymoorei TaxID=160699 RepID=A0A4D7DS84_9HYPH|nr:Crp/Fnr family transcriptional regulator [Agrobacterium larrymoorei]QCJ00164.1 Crp/Fnr family transcriptional regulator [Agrobacterium larrymoorei]QYA09393.1 Crp/Fnr family transcriptional regulator [Agrobacterium larrymoorei]
MDTDQGSVRNKILRALRPEDFEMLRPHMQIMKLNLHQVIEKPHTLIERVIFFETGLASIIGHISGGKSIEVGLIGREGMSGSAVILGSAEPGHRTLIQVAGYGVSVPASVVAEGMKTSESLRGVLLTYIHTMLAQTASTVVANGLSKLDKRLARWLLMIHDRIDGTTVAMTHEFLAVVLGVRRPGVTVALHILEGKGLIRASRGQITIINRQGLEQEAGGSYGMAESEYNRLMSKVRSRHSSENSLADKV